MDAVPIPPDCRSEIGGYGSPAFGCAIPAGREYGTDGAAGGDRGDAVATVFELADADWRGVAGAAGRAPEVPLVGRTGAGFSGVSEVVLVEFGVGVTPGVGALSAERAEIPDALVVARSLPFDGGLDSVTAIYPRLLVA